VSLLNVAVFSNVYFGGPTADDIHDDALSLLLSSLILTSFLLLLILASLF
jgi:hypothetical protein